MTREEQIKEAARQRADQYDHPVDWSDTYYGFIDGAKWADSHPQWHDAQGDIVPEYGREVIVIGRDGKVFYGHRPDPKEVTMVDGKPYHAKTYDKNGWLPFTGYGCDISPKKTVEFINRINDAADVLNGKEE